MNASHQAVVFEKHGTPHEIVHLTPQAYRALSPHEVRLSMKYAPINPADINILQGKYAILPPLPAIPGIEGVGIITEIGNDVTTIAIGTPVIAPLQIGSWCESRILNANQVVPISTEIPLEQAAMLAVNPPTAWRMLHDFVTLQPGDWIIQNAANSSVGRYVIQFAHALGVKTINIVRRESLIPELTAIGADVVLLDEKRFSRKVQKLVGDASIRLGLNAVGGESAREIARILSPHSTLVTYGAMGLSPLEIPNAMLIFQDLAFRGFWVTAWYKTASSAAIEKMFQELLPYLKRSNFQNPIEKIYPLAEIQAAVKHATQNQRGGKILLAMNP